MSCESIKPQSTSNNSLNPGVNYFDNYRIPVKCDGNCLKQGKAIFTHKQVVNIYIAFDINLWSSNVGKDFSSRNSLFGAVKLTTNADPDAYECSGDVIGFDASGSFLLSDGSKFGKNVMIFGSDMS